MPLPVYLTEAAERDLEQISRHIAAHDSPERADYVIGKISEVFSALEQYPNRGSYPRELISLGIKDFREVLFKPYRIIYRATNLSVHVMLIADGRRDMRTLLEKRLLQ